MTHACKCRYRMIKLDQGVVDHWCLIGKSIDKNSNSTGKSVKIKIHLVGRDVDRFGRGQSVGIRDSQVYSIASVTKIVMP